MSNIIVEQQKACGNTKIMHVDVCMSFHAQCYLHRLSICPNVERTYVDQIIIL